MENLAQIEYGKFYHIYNRGVNGDTLFYEDENCRYFLTLYAKYVEPLTNTFAWCLMKNHFHLLVRIKSEQEILASSSSLNFPASPSKPFSNLFNAYAQAINKRYHRTGNLFEKPFARKEIDSDRYFQALVCYIHTNPVHHRIVKSFRDYLWTSYHTIISSKETKLKRADVIAWFQNLENFKHCHEQKQHFETIKAYTIE